MTKIPNSFIQGRGTSSVPQDHQFTDRIIPAGRLIYRLRQVDLDIALHYSHPVAEEPGMKSMRFDAQTLGKRYL